MEELGEGQRAYPGTLSQKRRTILTDGGRPERPASVRPGDDATRREGQWLSRHL
jgi:hypothetical protein